ncbi:testis-specific Y-encoded-like protein 1 [Sorex fumeus]|uniref:testis-specific Y-encoded-like protein 1 n=1 Tax=Sorex fumeus TaxID=62283 RepID=UPI0024AD6082|nr:testis-specific Y-encoded-like protein 1 [Sorex fumeus]
MDGEEKTPLPPAPSPPAPDPAAVDAHPHQSPRLREEPEASQVMATTGEESSEVSALPQPQPSEEGGARRESGAWGLTPQALVAGDHCYVASNVEPLPDCPEAVSAAVAAYCRLRRVGQRGFGGDWARGGRGAERSGFGAMAPAEKLSSSAVEEEGEEAAQGGVKEEVAGEEMEVGENPAGAGGDAAGRNGPAPALRFRPLPMERRMNPLEAIQLELDTVNAQADRAFQHLEQKFGRMRRHYLERRNYIIQNIPGFWMTAFRNHPQLAPVIRGQDADMLRYVTNLEVKELRHPRTGCKFKFFFRRNPYFRNKLIVKEYEVRNSGRVVSLSTPIVWRRGHEPQSFIRRDQDMVCSFFTWFSDHSLPESDKIAEIIKEDLWPNPLQYYLSREGIRRPRRRPIREPVEIPRPFGFQSG